MKNKLFAAAVAIVVYSLFAVGFTMADNSGQISRGLTRMGLTSVEGEFQGAAGKLIDPMPLPRKPKLIDPMPLPRKPKLIDPMPLPRKPKLIDPMPLPRKPK